MKGLIDRVRKLWTDALEGAQSLVERASKIDLSGVIKTVRGGYKAAVDGAGNIVDAAGNRATHPATAFNEGVAAAVAAMDDGVDPEELDIDNPYD